MTKLWKSMEDKLAEIAPAVLHSLNPGVTDEAVAELENLIGTTLPADFVAFYKIHDGQTVGSDGITSPGLIEGEELMSFERITDEWTIWNELMDEEGFEDGNGSRISYSDAGVKDSHWIPRWIPITSNGCGDHYCLDLDPAEGGHRGQIIRMVHDDPGRGLEAISFREWMIHYTERLCNDELVYSGEYRGIIDKEWLDSDSD